MDDHSNPDLGRAMVSKKHWACKQEGVLRKALREPSPVSKGIKAASNYKRDRFRSDRSWLSSIDSDPGSQAHRSLYKSEELSIPQGLTPM